MPPLSSATPTTADACSGVHISRAAMAATLASTVAGLSMTSVGQRASSLAAWSGATPCACVTRKEGGWWAWEEEKEGVRGGGRAAWLPGRAPRPARL